MTPETTAHAVVSPAGDVILATIRPTAGEAKGAASNALRLATRWPSMEALGYRIVRVSITMLPDDSNSGDNL